VGRRTVTAQELADTAHRLVGSGKGLLAMDESNGTCESGSPLPAFHRLKKLDAPIAN